MSNVSTCRQCHYAFEWYVFAFPGTMVDPHSTPHPPCLLFQSFLQRLELPCLNSLCPVCARLVLLLWTHLPLRDSTADQARHRDKSVSQTTARAKMIASLTLITLESFPGTTAVTGDCCRVRTRRMRHCMPSAASAPHLGRRDHHISLTSLSNEAPIICTR